VDVPDHLRDASYRSASKIGFGLTYDYPHDFAGGWVDQQYLPDGLVGSVFFDPSNYGREQSLVEQWRQRRGHEDPESSSSQVE
jgi:putative ATPase